MSPPPPLKRASLRRFLPLAAFLLALEIGLAPVAAHVRAASLLLRFADEHATGGLAGLGRHAVDEELLDFETVNGPARGRIYRPRGVSAAPSSVGSVVLVHGVHRLGIEEPRLTRFARALASSGLVVLTPQVEEIADYRVDPRSIDTIGAAAAALDARTGGRAGVMGMSFAGGLSLLAAADPRYAAGIGFVVAIGGHHDLARVSRFFATNQIDRPDGSTTHLEAHGYGALVLIYGRIERFFSAEDAPAARDAIRLWLWDDRPAARLRAEALSPEGKATMAIVLDGRADQLAPEMLAVIERDRAGMGQVSPRGHLAGMGVPVFLLHGAGDTVIPSAETEWIAREVPPAMLRSALVSPALVHVELGPGTPAGQQWDIVHFMAGVLEEAEATGH